uniref:Uncharacterized protein n=1 Tax=Triticum urartu TaxID=4572 RepID=A0A8R7QW05_TRIUA
MQWRIVFCVLHSVAFYVSVYFPLLWIQILQGILGDSEFISVIQNVRSLMGMADNFLCGNESGSPRLLLHRQRMESQIEDHMLVPINS